MRGPGSANNKRGRHVGVCRVFMRTNAIYLVTFSQKFIMIRATSARVALPVG